LFSRDKGAYVGYSSCEASFYLLRTDCVATLSRLLRVHPRLSEARELFARANKPLPEDPGQSFIHGMGVIARQPGDTISTVGLFDPDPTSGSVMLYAGWQVNGEPYGAPMRDMCPSQVSCWELSSMTHESPTLFGHPAARRRPSIE